MMEPSTEPVMQPTIEPSTEPLMEPTYEPSKLPTVAPTSLQVCFSGSSHVESNNSNNGIKLMSKMKLGDEVLSYNRKTKVK